MPILPNTYQWVEYIESSGTQRIDTGVTATQNTKSQIKFMNLERTGDVIYGLYTGNDNTDYRFFNKYNNDDPLFAGCAIFDFNSSRVYSAAGTINTNTIYELEFGNYYIKNLESGTNIVSGTTIGSYTSPRTITLNNYNNSTYSKNRWYYVKIYDGTTLVRDFLPCYRKEDGVIGLYDVVNNQFYTNSGTGTFIKGPDKVLKVSRAYIGTEQIRPKKETWTLYKETDFQNSSFGGFRTAGWYNSSSPSYVAFNTTDGNIYSTSSHSRCKICPDTNDLALFQSAKAIKIVTDGIYIGNNTNRYNSWVGLGGWWQEFGKKSSGMNYPTLLSGTALTYGVWYKSETILTKEDSLITTLDNGSSYGITYQSGLWNQLVSTSSNSYFYPSASDNLMCMAEVALDNGTTSALKDVHVYLLF